MRDPFEFRHLRATAGAFLFGDQRKGQPDWLPDGQIECYSRVFAVGCFGEALDRPATLVYTPPVA